jgi:hypothetical protein
MKRRGSSLLAFVLPLASCLALAGPATASEIVVCAHAGFRPPCVELRHGANDLREWGMTDRISSFSVRSGAWLLCTETGFRGRCEVVNRSYENLQGTAFQDSISSLRPVREGGDGSWGGYGDAAGWQRLAIAVYAGPNYTGRSWVVSDDVRDLGLLGLGNRISSVRVLGGRWRICRQADFRGCAEVTGDIPDLRRFGFDDQISSIQEIGPAGWTGGSPGHDGPGYRGPGHGGPGPGGQGPGWDGPRRSATLYDRNRFRGRSISVTGPVSNLSRSGFNDRASSIRLEGRWLLCSDADFRGRCRTVNGDVENLSRLGLGNALSSMRPER